MPFRVNDPRKFGAPLEGWCPPAHPTDMALLGQHVELTGIDPDVHADPLFKAFETHDFVWDYLPYGPFSSARDYSDWMNKIATLRDPLFFAIRNLEEGTFQGVASYLRITPEHGSIEVGHINFSPSLQGTCAATEAMYLMMAWAFDAGYRRYEWKCDALNMASRRAAQRLGFSYEGIFRQAAIVKGRNRDTVWYAILDSEWPRLRQAFAQWLAPENFDNGRQKQSLGTLTGPVRVASDPALETCIR